MKEIVPIVFATDDNYVPYLGVALHSLIRHTSSKTDYKIYILATNLSKWNRSRLENLSKENVHIEFRDVSEEMKKWKIPVINHLTNATAYRLLADKIFPEHKKILYLDSDIVVCRDVAELYHMDLKKNVLGAVLGRLNEWTVYHVKKELKVPLSSFFNAGVLLIDLRMFAKLEIGRRSLEMLQAGKYACQDQDPLNMLCLDKVMYLDGHWNVEWMHQFADLIEDDARKGMIEYTKDPYIVHYSTPNKPWNRPDVPMAEYFWDAAKESIFYEEILFRRMRSMVNAIPRPSDPQKEPDIYARFIFPWNSVRPGARIIIYGGGVVGKTFLQQISRNPYCHVVAVCDRSPEKTGIREAPVIRIKDLAGMPRDLYETVLIAIEKREVAKDIRQDLIFAGIEEEKILWVDPARL